MLLVHYQTVGQLQQALGHTLKFWDDPKREDDNYSPDGEFIVCNLPGRYFFKARVVMRGGLIQSVEVL